MPARRHHPTLPFSSFPAFSKCAQYKSGPVGPAAIRGTRIGATVEEMLTGQKQDEAYTEEELTADPKLRAEIEWAYHAVEALHEGTVGLEVEREVPLIDDSFEEVTFGTCDYYRDGHLSDLKTGEKRSYRAQMAGLSLGFMDRDGLEAMTVSIVWSRFQEVETWTWTREEVEAIVWPIIESVLRQDAPRPNEYCSWCEKKETCTARTKAVANLPTNIPTTGKLEVHLDAISPAERAHLIKQIAVAKKWCEDAENAIEEWFLKDPVAHAIDGMKLGKSQPKRVWMNEDAAAQALQAKAVEMGKDAAQLTLTKIVPAARLKEILGGSKPVKDLIDSLMVKPEGKPALVVDWTRGKRAEALPGEAQDEQPETKELN